MTDPVSIGDVEAAAARLDGVVVETPLLQHPELDRLAGGAVLIKPECLQRVGSFKIRGAYNLLSQLTPGQAKKGVVAWSSGNHAQGVAMAARLLGIQAAIVMPADAPQSKLDNTRRLGGEVITYDRYSEDREAIAHRLAAERGAAVVPSFEHPHIIAGQGTVGLEIADQSLALRLPADQALVCCGGGGLIAGSAIALKDRLPGIAVYAVEPQGFDDTTRSLQAGRRLGNDPEARSICDALLSPSPGELTFAIMQRLVDGGLVVSDEEVKAAMRFAFQHLKLVVEPGGAVALAAVLAGRLETKGRTTAIVLSGGNVDADLFGAIQTERN